MRVTSPPLHRTLPAWPPRGCSSYGPVAETRVCRGAISGCCVQMPCTGWAGPGVVPWAQRFGLVLGILSGLGLDLFHCGHSRLAQGVVAGSSADAHSPQQGEGKMGSGALQPDADHRAGAGRLVTGLSRKGTRSPSKPSLHFWPSPLAFCSHCSLHCGLLAHPTLAHPCHYHWTEHCANICPVMFVLQRQDSFLFNST